MLNDKGFEYSTKPIVGTINGKERTLYEEAYKYKFKITLKMPIGDKMVEWTAQTTSILIDQDAYAIDRELNIYRTVKIGEDIWTIDNYRGTKNPFLEYKTSNNSEYANNGFYFYCKRNRHRYEDNYPLWVETALPIINSHIINGYELPTTTDWNRLVSSLGIDFANTQRITAIEPFCLFGEDESEYEKYWAKNTPWKVFAPENESEAPLSFNVFAAGLYDKELDDIRWSNEVASFVCTDDDLENPSHEFIYAVVISKKHKSMGQSFYGKDFSNIRLVRRGK